MNCSVANGTKQPTWRLWGEDKTADAVYTVYLKKVRYFNPKTSKTPPNMRQSTEDLLNLSNSDSSISHLEWETVRVKVLKAGSLEKLIGSLATETGELESSHLNIFLATYRSFTTIGDILDILIQRYQKLCDKDCDVKDDLRDELRKTLRLALSVWLDNYPEDFYDPPDHKCLNDVINFAETYMADTELLERSRKKLNSFLSKAKSTPTKDSSKEVDEVDSDFQSGQTSIQSFLDAPSRLIAEQLTQIDADLFRKVVIPQCLGSAWGNRDKLGRVSDRVSTVAATIDQFNAVSLRVIATVLADPLMRPSQRARVISKWIDIAQELRLLKNFSSLKAIISGLQSNVVYRLRKIWLAISREKIELFEEMARIFCEENNAVACRELLMREGTAKMADTVGNNDKHLSKAISRQMLFSKAVIQGTVPYLGTFLTDLTMINTAVQDLTPDGLINFDKRRKEFEVLAQIRLLQSAASSYSIHPEANFKRWFGNLPVLDDKDSYDLSCQIEAPTVGTTPRKPNHNQTMGHRKTGSVASTSSSSSGHFELVSSGENNSMNSATSNSVQDTTAVNLERKMSTGSSNCSVLSMDSSLPNSVASTPVQSPSKALADRTPGDSGTLVSQGSASPYVSADFYIIKVSVDEGNVHEIQGVNLYKSIMLSNNEHTPSVIKNVLAKHGIEGSSDNFTLSQVLNDGSEMLLPPKANVYYAINTAHDLNFILRRKVSDNSGTLKGKDSPIALYSTNRESTGTLNISPLRRNKSPAKSHSIFPVSLEF